MKKEAYVAIVLSLGVLGGCAHSPFERSVSAEPLKYDPATVTALAADTDAKQKSFLGDLVGQSIVSCNHFMNGLVITESSTNVTGDIVTTSLSALSRLLRP